MAAMAAWVPRLRSLGVQENRCLNCLSRAREGGERRGARTCVGCGILFCSEECYLRGRDSHRLLCGARCRRGLAGERWQEEGEEDGDEEDDEDEGQERAATMMEVKVMCLTQAAGGHEEEEEEEDEEGEEDEDEGVSDVDVEEEEDEILEETPPEIGEVVLLALEVLGRAYSGSDVAAAVLDHLVSIPLRQAATWSDMDEGEEESFLREVAQALQSAELPFFPLPGAVWHHELEADTGDALLRDLSELCFRVRGSCVWVQAETSIHVECQRLMLASEAERQHRIGELIGDEHALSERPISETYGSNRNSLDVLMSHTHGVAPFAALVLPSLQVLKLERSCDPNASLELSPQGELYIKSKPERRDGEPTSICHGPARLDVTISAHSHDGRRQRCSCSDYKRAKYALHRNRFAKARALLEGYTHKDLDPYHLGVALLNIGDFQGSRMAWKASANPVAVKQCAGDAVYRQALDPSHRTLSTVTSEQLSEGIYLSKPLLTAEECRGVIEACEGNWTSSRHISIPTTDVPVENIPTALAAFANAMKRGLSRILVERFPHVFLSPSCIRVHDAFVVKYVGQCVGQSGRSGLPSHTDQSEVSLTLSLNDAFVGGGTCFEALEWRVVSPPVGAAVAFSGDHFHGGFPITSGERYIIAAFLYGDCPLRSLPEELLASHICDKIDGKDFASLGMTCRRFNAFAFKSSDDIWKRKCIKRWGREVENQLESSWASLYAHRHVIGDVALAWLDLAVSSYDTLRGLLGDEKIALYMRNGCVGDIREFEHFKLKESLESFFHSTGKFGIYTCSGRMNARRFQLSKFKHSCQDLLESCEHAVGSYIQEVAEGLQLYDFWGGGFVLWDQTVRKRSAIQFVLSFANVLSGDRFYPFEFSRSLSMSLKQLDDNILSVLEEAPQVTAETPPPIGLPSTHWWYFPQSSPVYEAC